MARPSKNAEGPSATERMEMAFWECLTEKPYSEIVVRDIVDRANVNRNSYYYHYESMWDLALDSVKNAKLEYLAHALLNEENNLSQPNSSEDEENTRSEFDLNPVYTHFRVLASENGNQKLLDAAKQIISGEWLAMYKLNPENVTEEIQLAIDFSFGGIVALLASEQFDTLNSFRKKTNQSDVLLDTFDLLRGELDPNVNRKSRWLPRSSFKRTEETVVVEQVYGAEVVSDSIVDEIMADVKSSQVREVLAPQPVSEEKSTRNFVENSEPKKIVEEVIESKIIENSGSKEEIFEDAKLPQEQVNISEPTEPLEVEESIKSSEITSEEEVEIKVSDAQFNEETKEAQEHEEVVPEQTEDLETQQATEDNHEEYIEQEPASEQEVQEDYPPVEPIGVVSALESLQEIDEDDDDEQEPVRRYDASNPARRLINTDTAIQDTTQHVAYTKSSEYTGGSDGADIDEAMSTELDSGLDIDSLLMTNSIEDDNDDDQLSMDFLF